MKYFYGIKGIELVSHGCWSDPELIYKDYPFNYYDVETPLWETYREDCTENGITPNENDFVMWVKNNSYLAFEYLENLMESRIFYGGRES